MASEIKQKVPFIHDFEVLCAEHDLVVDSTSIVETKKEIRFSLNVKYPKDGQQQTLGLEGTEHVGPAVNPESAD